jgi:S-DNA-T family DNA segregation ATPase FtsK/SpoIIIE
MGKDVGTSILTGATTERFEIVKWFYIEADDDAGYDAAADIIARAVANLHPAGAGPADGHDEPAQLMRDLLDDVATVLGADRGGGTACRRQHEACATSGCRVGEALA